MMGAALAYYSIFSFGPLLVISTAIAGLVFGPDAVHGEIAAQVAGLLGSAGAEALETLLAAANRPYQGALATIFGIGTLLFAAVGVVAQLKEALNTVWGVQTSDSSGLLQLIRTYVISLAGVLSPASASAAQRHRVFVAWRQQAPERQAERQAETSN